MRSVLLALSCFAIPGLSQTLSFGAKGGLRLTADVPAYGASNSKRYLIGPAFEVGFPLRLAFEVDALYSRLGNTFYIPSIANESDIRTIADSLEFPFLVKYRLPLRRVRPFASVGAAPRYAAGKIHTIHYGYYPSDVAFSSVNWHAHDRALVFGAGLSMRTAGIRIVPEVRYLKWKIPRAPSSDDVAYYLRPPRNDEVQFLLEIGWSNK